MKVIFLQHVINVAKKGEIKEVLSGYASNFLFPKKYAKPYTQNIEDTIAKSEQKKESERRMLLGGQQEIIDTLEGKIFEFTLKASGEKVYGSISPKEVAEYIVKKYRFPITKKHIDFGGVHSSFKTLGEHDIYIDLGKNYAVKAIVNIKPSV